MSWRTYHTAGRGSGEHQGRDWRGKRAAPTIAKKSGEQSRKEESAKTREIHT